MQLLSECRSCTNWRFLKLIGQLAKKCLSGACRVGNWNSVGSKFATASVITRMLEWILNIFNIPRTTNGAYLISISQAMKGKLEQYSSVVKSPLAHFVPVFDSWIRSDDNGDCDILRAHVQHTRGHSDRQTYIIETFTVSAEPVRYVFAEAFDNNSRDGTDDEIDSFLRSMVSSGCNGVSVGWWAHERHFLILAAKSPEILPIDVFLVTSKPVFSESGSLLTESMCLMPAECVTAEVGLRLWMTLLK